MLLLPEGMLLYADNILDLLFNYLVSNFSSGLVLQNSLTSSSSKLFKLYIFTHSLSISVYSINTLDISTVVVNFVFTRFVCFVMVYLFYDGYYHLGILRPRILVYDSVLKEDV